MTEEYIKGLEPLIRKIKFELAEVQYYIRDKDKVCTKIKTEFLLRAVQELDKELEKIQELA